MQVAEDKKGSDNPHANLVEEHQYLEHIAQLQATHEHADIRDKATAIVEEFFSDVNISVTSSGK